MFMLSYFNGTYKNYTWTRFFLYLSWYTDEVGGGGSRYGGGAGGSLYGGAMRWLGESDKSEPQ